MAPEVGAAWALEDIITYNVHPCFHVGLELPWVLMKVRGAEADIIFPVMEGPGTLDEKMVPEPFPSHTSRPGLQQGYSPVAVSSKEQS